MRLGFVFRRNRDPRQNPAPRLSILLRRRYGIRQPDLNWEAPAIQGLPTGNQRNAATASIFTSATLYPGRTVGKGSSLYFHRIKAGAFNYNTPTCPGLRRSRPNSI